MNAKSTLTRITLITFLLLCSPRRGRRGRANPFVGEWALTIGKGGAGWLGVKDDNGKPTASLLWIAGSVEKVPEAKIEGDTLVLTLGRPNARNANANPETITVKVDGDTLKGERPRLRRQRRRRRREAGVHRQAPAAGPARLRTCRR